MVVHYKICHYSNANPLAVEVLDSEGGLVRIREIAANVTRYVRRSEQLFETFEAARLALIDSHLLNIEFAEQHIAEARKRLHELVLLREPRHEP